jgi:TetR/AcrR family transcriptional repressor of nem operon
MSETRAQLKSIAIDQIRQANLSAASFRELGKAAGIKSSSVHYHFQSREKLLTELLQDYDVDFFRHLNAQTSDSRRTKEKLMALIKVFEDGHQQKRQCMSLAYAASPQELSEANLEAFHTFVAHLEDWVSEALNHASLLPISRQELACLIVSALEGSLLLDRLHPDPKHLNAAKAWISTLSRF